MPRIDSGGAYPAQLPRENARAILKRRAGLVASIRDYFDRDGLVEVCTPQLGPFPASDPRLENFRVENPLATAALPRDMYLQTSPESAMKQLLARGSGSIYQICQAYRVDAPGALHAMEFSMLEWYRVDYDFDQIIADTLKLTASLLGEKKIELLSYRRAFLDSLGVDTHVIAPGDLRELANNLLDVSFGDDPESSDIWLDLLFSHCVAPTLGRNCFTIIRDFPESQAAMSELHSDEDGHTVAARFELFIEGVEIANGYRELCDWREQQRRFERDKLLRKRSGLAEVAIDRDLLAAMRDPGLPACAGVALGIDRLLMFAD